VTSVTGTAILGQTSENGAGIVSVTGVQATGEVGTVLVWSRIVPSGNPNWTEIIAA